MKHRPEYRELEKTEGTLWRNKCPKDLLPNFTIVQSLQIIRELEDIWVLFPFSSSYFERALRVLWKASNQDNRFIAVADSALPDSEEYRGLQRAATWLGFNTQEKVLIELALSEARGRVSGPSGAAVKLGIPASTLESKIRSLKINKRLFKAP